MATEGHDRKLFIDFRIEDFTSSTYGEGSEPATDDKDYQAVGVHVTPSPIISRVTWTSKDFYISDYVEEPIGDIELRTFEYAVMQTGWIFNVRSTVIGIYVNDNLVVKKDVKIPDWDVYTPQSFPIGIMVSPIDRVKIAIQFEDSPRVIADYYRFVGQIRIVGKYESMVPPSEGTVVITVQDADTGYPVKDALVRVLKDETIVSSGKTDANGEVSMSLFEGDYVARIIKSGYEMVEIPIWVPAGETVNYSVSLLSLPPPWWIEWLSNNWPWLVGGAVVIIGGYIVVKRLTGVSPVTIIRERVVPYVREKVRPERAEYVEFPSM